MQVNILVTPSLHACLADFGLSTLRNDAAAFFSVTMNSSDEVVKGTIPWQAPELLDWEHQYWTEVQYNSLASDIYSFACVYYEVPCTCLVSMLANANVRYS